MKGLIAILFTIAAHNLTAQDFEYGWHNTDDNTGLGIGIIRQNNDTLYMLNVFSEDSIDANPGIGIDYLYNLGSSFTGSAVYVSRFLPNGTYLGSDVLITNISNFIEIYDFEISPSHKMVIIGRAAAANIDFDPSSSIANSYTGTSNISYAAFYSTQGVYEGHFEYSCSGPNRFYFTDVSIDENNEFYIAGTIQGTIDLDFTAGVDLHTSTGSNDAAIIKVNLISQSFVWGRNFGNTNNEYISNIDVKSGIIAMTGVWESGTVDFDPGSGTSTSTSPFAPGIDSLYVFISRWQTNGTYLTHTYFEGNGDAYPLCIKLDDDLSIYSLNIYTNANSQIDVDVNNSSHFINTSYADGMFLVKYDSNLNMDWARSFICENGTYSNGVNSKLAVGSQYVSVCSNYYDGNLQIADGVLNDTIATTVSGGYDLFVVAIDKVNASVIDVVTYLGSSSGTAYAEAGGMILDDAENCYLTGNFQEEMDFNPFDSIANVDTVTTEWYSNSFLLKLNWADASGIEENSLTNLKVYPNPTSLTIHFQAEEVIESIQLTDMNGRIIATVTPNTKQTEMDLTQLNSGIYFAKIQTISGKTNTQKIIKN